MKPSTLLASLALPLIAAPFAAAQVVTIGLEASHHTDPDGGANTLWENDGGLSIGVDREVGLNAVYRPAASTLHRNITGAYDLQGGQTGTNRSFRLAPANPDSYGEVLGNNFTTIDASFEIWFKPPTFDTAANNNDGNMRYRVLWETGGGTGTGFVIHGSTLCFASRSANNQAIATVDLVADLGLGPDEFIQAVGVVRIQDDIDNPDGVQLFVNGQLVGEAAPAPGTNLTDWDGGDGDGLGGRGGANLGGYGNGFGVHDPDGAGPLTPPGGEGWRSFGGEIGIFRWYSIPLTAAEVLQNFEAVTGDIRFAEDFGEWDFDAEFVWGGNKPAATDTTVMIGGGFNVSLFTPETVDALVVGHQSGTAETNGTGTLTVDLGGALDTNSLVVGGSGLPGTGNNVNINDTGTVNVAGDLVYGAASDQGGNVRVNLGGTLNVTGSVIERAPSVNTAQFYLNGGTANIDGDITVQSFRTGDAGGSIATYTQPAGQTITNTGTFFAGNNGVGTHVLEGGTINVDNSIRISEQGGGTGSSLVVNDGTVHNRLGNNNGNTNKQLDIARRGDGSVVVNGGTFTNDATIRFGNDADTVGTLDVNGGTFVQNGDIITGNANNGAATSRINVAGGVFDLADNGDRRSVTEMTHSDGEVIFRITDTTNGPPTLQVADFLSFTTTDGAPTITPVVDLPLSVNNGEIDTWTGPGGTVLAPVSGTWDETGAHWQTTAGDQLIPAAGGGALNTGTAYPLATAFLINDFANVASGDPNWDLTSDGANITATYTGPVTGSAMPALISGSGVTVTRSGSLLVAPNTPLVDTTQLTVDGATLDISGADSDLNLGGAGNTDATVTLDAGATLTVGRNVIFGPTLQRGGILNINGGSTLTVGGSVGETDPAVPNAQLQINNGTLDMTNGGAILVQRFSVGEATGANASYTAQGDVTTTGTLNVAASGTAVGTFTVNNPDHTVTAANASIGQGLANNGSDTVNATFNLLAGTFQTTAGNFNIAGDNQADTGVTATVVFGGAQEAVVSVTGGNSEWGHGGTANITIDNVEYTQNTNNIVIAQGASSVSNVTMNGGTVTTGAVNDLNFNRGTGVLTINGGDFNVGRNINMGNTAATSDMEINIAGGNLRAGQDLSYRGNGVRDVINLTAGLLDVTRNVNFGNQVGGDDQFNHTGGTFQIGDNGIFNGDYAQAGGTFSPVDGPGTVQVTGGYTASPSSTLRIDIDWDGAGFPFEGINNDILRVGGDFDPAGANLQLNIVDPLMITAPIGTVFIIVDAAAAPLGTFAQGNTITADGFTFTIDYGGFNGDDVELVLTGLPGSGTSDGDADGLVDLLESAFGTSATDSTDGPGALPTVAVAAGNATITFRRLTAPGNITYQVQSSTDLVNWTDVDTPPVLAPDQSGLPAGVERVQTAVPLDTSGPETYLRLVVSEG